jgi:hypothetical protein
MERSSIILHSSSTGHGQVFSRSFIHIPFHYPHYNMVRGSTTPPLWDAILKVSGMLMWCKFSSLRAHTRKTDINCITALHVNAARVTFVIAARCPDAKPQLTPVPRHRIRMHTASAENTPISRLAPTRRWTRASILLSNTMPCCLSKMYLCNCMPPMKSTPP